MMLGVGLSTMLIVIGLPVLLVIGVAAGLRGALGQPRRADVHAARAAGIHLCGFSCALLLSLRTGFAGRVDALPTVRRARHKIDK